ncbi:MAG: AAA family ATPase [Candidatus Binataceae bacterium]
MYYRSFGLSGPPFQFTPSAPTLYLSKAHREGLALLEWGLVHEPSGFTLLAGEPGTGKTTLICSILAREFEHVRVVYLADPKLRFDEILRTIVSQLGIEPKSAGGKFDYLQALTRYLAGLKTGERVAIVVDEAQDLSDDALEELRLLSNQGRTDEKQIQLVLVGQPELMRRLMSPGLRQFGERIGARAVLNPLERDEIFGYIECRLSAREGHSREIFAPKALESIADYSGGIPRRINVLCHNAMLLAYSLGARQVSGKMARAAVTEYDNLFNASPKAEPLAARPRKRAPFKWMAIAGAAAVLIALGFYMQPAPARVADQPLSTELPRDIAQDSHAVKQAADNSAAAAEPAPLTPIMAVGGNRGKSANTQTAHVKNAAAAVNPKPGLNGRTVQVRHGDTLSSIAIQYLGSANNLPKLIDANPQLENVDHIYPGQTIRIPAARQTAKQE